MSPRSRAERRRWWRTRSGSAGSTGRGGGVAHDARINVAIESAIHDALMDLIQRIADEHHIRVHHVYADWVGVSRVDGTRNILRKVAIDSDKYYKGKVGYHDA